jgi:hypothetical protein
MQQFIETELMFLIREQVERSVSIAEWEQAYEAFAAKIFSANAKFCSNPEYLNCLCYARAEFAFLHEKGDLKKKYACI